MINSLNLYRDYQNSASNRENSRRLADLQEAKFSQSQALLPQQIEGQRLSNLSRVAQLEGRNREQQLQERRHIDNMSLAREKLRANENLMRERIKATSDKKSSGKQAQLPVGALKMQNELIEEVGVHDSHDKELSRIHDQINNKEIDLGPIANPLHSLRNKLDLSNPESVKYQTLKSTFVKLRNEMLRQNKGTQTDKDAIQEMEALIENLNDTEVVKDRINKIRGYNKQAATKKAYQAEEIRRNYGLEPLDFGKIKSMGAYGDEVKNSTRFDALPDPKGYEGKTVRDEKTGIRYRSNNGRWQTIRE